MLLNINAFVKPLMVIKTALKPLAKKVIVEILLPYAIEQIYKVLDLADETALDKVRSKKSPVTTEDYEQAAKTIQDAKEAVQKVKAVHGLIKGRI